MSFSLGSPVGDVAWSPFSATIFAAVTDDGLARVYDLSQNATEPLCEQRITAKAALTRIAFSPRMDVILIGDSRSAAIEAPTEASIQYSTMRSLALWLHSPRLYTQVQSGIAVV